MTDDSKIKQLWIEECQRRYYAYLKGELAALSGEEVMKRARAQLAREAEKPRSGEIFIEPSTNQNS